MPKKADLLPRFQASQPLPNPQQEQAAQHLGRCIRRLTKNNQAALEARRHDATKLSKRRDLVWHRVLGAHATLGNSRGAEGVNARRSDFAFEKFYKLSPAMRRRRAEKLFAEAKVRMPQQKARWLVANVDRVAKMGGLAAAKAQLDGLTQRDAFLRWWKQFDGIGDKYARNIMMDLCHPAFRQSIAVDARLQRVLRRLGLKLKAYPDAERFFLRTAACAKVDGWTLDRIVYEHLSEVLSSLSDLNFAATPNASTGPKDRKTLARALFALSKQGNLKLSQIEALIEEFL